MSEALPRVFVPSVPMVRDPRTGGRVPKIDLSPASEHGILTDVFGGDGLPPAPDAMAATALAKMRDYSEGDFVLLTGDPAAIAVTVALAARRGATLRLLKWVRAEWSPDGGGKPGRYIVLNYDLAATEEEAR